MFFLGSECRECERIDRPAFENSRSVAEIRRTSFLWRRGVPHCHPTDVIRGARYEPDRPSPQQQPFAAHIVAARGNRRRSEEHTSELQSLMRISYAVFCLKKKKKKNPLLHQTKHTHLYT